MQAVSSAIRPGFAERQNLAAQNWMYARARGLVCQFAEDERFDGRSLTLNGRRLVNFGSCSYLGLETEARLKTAACEAVLRYGVQFSTSRAYVAAPLYRELERLLSELAGGSRVVLAPTTSLAHLGALPVLVGERDAVLYDTQVHASAQAVLPELRMRGIPCEAVRHNRLDRLEQRARALAADHERVFYLCDGVYSMHGDLLDTDALYDVLDRNPTLHAYVDDAHGVGWSGVRGAGTVLGRRPIHSRMVVVLGLAKSFAAAGGALVFPNAEWAERVLTCGRTLIFSGPIQPAQLGAGIASAKIHLSGELPLLQERLLLRIDAFDLAAANEGVAVVDAARSPIRFVPIGDERATIDLAASLLERGHYVNVAYYPAVPRRRAGIRVVLNAHQSPEDITCLVRDIACSRPGIAAAAPNLLAAPAGPNLLEACPPSAAE
jgi:7-keto-8-aminopelargonate synthetase-like enzyme